MRRETKNGTNKRGDLREMCGKGLRDGTRGNHAVESKMNIRNGAMGKTFGRPSFQTFQTFWVIVEFRGAEG